MTNATEPRHTALTAAIASVADAEALAFMWGHEGAVIAAMEAAIVRLTQSVLDRMARLPITPDHDEEAV
jgi:hypothetical protein